MIHYFPPSRRRCPAEIDDNLNRSRWSHPIKRRRFMERKRPVARAGASLREAELKHLGIGDITSQIRRW